MSEKIFYSIPFRAERLTGGGKLERCDFAVSVRQNWRLLLMTPPMRVRFDPFYGCKVHWQQFLASNRAMERKREEDDFISRVERNIEALIQRFEPRIELKDVTVNIHYAKEDQKRWSLSDTRLSQNHVIQLIVKIRGTVKPEFAYGQTLDLEDTIPLL